MNNLLAEFLTEQGYAKIKLKLTKTNHFELKATINGVKGLFILDTGASSSCVGFDEANIFKLNVEASKIKAAGAGASGMETQISKNNKVKIGKWNTNKVSLVLFDLIHINTALIVHDAQAVNGIIGADILRKGKAIIDYDKKYLYLNAKT